MPAGLSKNYTRPTCPLPQVRGKNRQKANVLTSPWRNLVRFLLKVKELLKMKEPETEVTLEFSEQGFRRVLVGSKTDEELEAACRLLGRVAPELRALDEALRKTTGV